MSRKPLRVAVFCGGRGSLSLLRELIRDEDVELTLLINAYDDGLSTGALRRLIPGMLGPSDFRKNLSYLLELHSRQQFDLARILEHRLPSPFGDAELDRLVRDLLSGRAGDAGASPTARLFASLEPALATRLGTHLATFRDRMRDEQGPGRYDDFALGNLVFVGAYLEHRGGFNVAVRELSREMGCRATLVNVTCGESRVLVGLKEDGEILASEAAIVGPQSAARIVALYLLESRLDDAELAELAPLDLAEKRRRLAALDRPVELSPEARATLAEADLVVYGPGTQHSSLLPSYKTRGLADAIASSPANVRALVVNLASDHDIQSLGATEIVDEALAYLDDPDNRRRLVTHVLASRAPGAAEPAPRGPGPAGPTYKGATWIERDFRNPGYPGLHSGHATAAGLRGALRAARGEGADTLDLYVDLRDRALAAPLLVQEFAEIDWGRHFASTRLRLNGAAVPDVALPAAASVEAASYTGLFGEVAVLKDWLERGSSSYLVTLAGDGEYRLSDIVVAFEALRASSFGAVFGSRNQRRAQAQASLRDAYGEARSLYLASWVGAFVFAGVYAARYRFMLSDPFTGFRVYRRSAIDGDARRALLSATTAADVVKILLASGIEIAEIPVSYRTFRGFVNVPTRLSRGLRNAASSLT